MHDRSRRGGTALLLVAAALSSAAVAQEAEPRYADWLEVESALLVLMDQADIAAREDGILQEVVVEEGDIVRAGDLLATQDTEEERIALTQAEIDHGAAQLQADNTVLVRLAEKAVRYAEVELQRAEDAAERVVGSVSSTELDRLRLDLDRAHLDLEQATIARQASALAAQAAAARLDLASLRVERRQLRSPQDGIVVQVYRRPGEWLDAGTPVMRLLRTDRLRVEGLMESRLAVPGLVGRPASISLEGPEGEVTLSGVVTFVSPEVLPSNQRVRVIAEVQNPERIARPGQQVTLRIRRP